MFGVSINACEFGGIEVFASFLIGLKRYLFLRGRARALLLALCHRIIEKEKPTVVPELHVLPRL